MTARQNNSRQEPANAVLTQALSLHSLGVPVDVETEHGWRLIMCWETGRLHRLLANHPGRRIDIPEWAQPEFVVLSGRKIPVPLTLPRPQKSDRSAPGGGHQTIAAGLEDVLGALREAGCRPFPKGGGEWRSMCPIDMLRSKLDRRVTVRIGPDDGRVSIHCFGNCSEADLLAELGISPYQLPQRRPHYLLAGKVDLDYVLGEGSHAA